MNNRITILNELKEISPVVANIPFEQVYLVPQGYFESMPALLLSQAKDEENRMSGALPDGYFDQLADTILAKIKGADISKEADEVSPMLQSLRGISVYQTPVGYFETLSNSILESLEDKTAAEELRSLSPMLYSIQAENVYEVPKGYFESVASDLMNQLQPKSAKIIRMQSSRVWMRYAVAALFTGFMALSVFKFLPTTESNNHSLTVAQIQGLQIAKENRFEEELAKVSDEEIIGFLTRDGVDVDAAITFAAVQENDRSTETISNNTESNEIDELLNQLDENKSMN